MSEPKQIDFSISTLEPEPFRHAVIDELLASSDYSAVVSELNALLTRGLSESYVPRLFSRQGEYDAYSYTIPWSETSMAARLFYSAEWQRRVSEVFNIRLNACTLLAFHHHKPFGKDGRIHNDFNTAYFLKKEPLPTGLRHWFHEHPYMRTKAAHDGIERVVRAIALIYYLDCDPNWQPGDGGETGLYREKNPDSLVKRVEPRNNRLLIFENSPASFHRYLANTSAPRNCIVQWFHSGYEDALARCGQTPDF